MYKHEITSEQSKEPYLFINYRKEDTVVLADGINMMLKDELGSVVFMDNSKLDKGAIFSSIIQDALTKSTCMLVFIGKEWLFVRDDKSGRRRIDDKDDWVLKEIEYAIENSITIIPVFAPGVSRIPIKKDLPQSINSLSDRVPIMLRSETYPEDRAALLNELLEKHGFQRRSEEPSINQNNVSLSDYTSIDFSKFYGYKGTQFQQITEKEQIRAGTKLWINGATIHYYFVDFSANENKYIVREAFLKWSEAALGLKFVEVNNEEDAEIKISFNPMESSYSYVGCDAVKLGAKDPTMNLNFELHVWYEKIDITLSKIGHVLGFYPEHQNPHNGIIWNKEAVISKFSNAPYFWSTAVISNNILKKGDPENYYGTWDPDSIMHYPFEAGLIKEPREYRDGLLPTPGLSAGDKAKAKFLYPSLSTVDQVISVLRPVHLNIQPGEQINLKVIPHKSRIYNFQTFGSVQVLMQLFEINGEDFLYAEGDEIGNYEDYTFNVRLFKGKVYALRLRLLARNGDGIIMMW